MQVFSCYVPLLMEGTDNSEYMCICVSVFVSWLVHWKDVGLWYVVSFGRAISADNAMPYNQAEIRQAA